MSTPGRIEAPDSLDEINNVFYRMGLTDGLPIVPPTMERVEEMLQAVQRDPEDAVGIVPPKQGVATIQKIATNAVMAGCLPDYLPVIIAAVEAVLEPGFNLYGMQSSANPVTPLFIINGPVARRLEINGGYNCLSGGTRANATIGRAMRLILMNIGGGIPGGTDRDTQGQPGRYSLCFAENEAQSPWPPFHSDRGFDADSSTVSAFGAGGTINVRPKARDARQALATVARLMALGGSPRHSTHGLLILCPELARRMADDGYSKEDVRRYLFENARIRPCGFTAEVAQRLIDEPVKHDTDVRAMVGEITTDTLIPWAHRPEGILIVVAGGAGPMSTFVPGIFTQPTPIVTKLVR
ncbi:MAG: hypothetical protein HYX92_04120 [Chloroflexi bacterium]|nr:hypothetical protein [Chloroflexota bacterium]